jgi:hypothetical protein
MTHAEKVEIALIAAAAPGGSFIGPTLFPEHPALGSLLLVVFSLLMVQSLLRDLWLLFSGPPAIAPEAAHCMCMESAVGAIGMVGGITILGAGIGQPVELAAWAWAILFFSATATGFLIKDFVFTWNPWSIRREKNHLNIVVKWRK